MTPLVSYAQNFEDVMLWRALKHVGKGRYIDVGAQDPTIDSVSKFFHEQGWQGIHVEPTPHYAQQLRQARPNDVVLQVALGNKGGTLKFYEFPDTGLSTADRVIAKRHMKGGFPCREIVVPCITLDDVFQQHAGKEIHWLKIDVEGGEQRVLKGWLRSNVRPWIVLIESTLPLTQTEAYQKWEPIILAKGYKFAYFDGLNRFYVSTERPELLAAFTAGPNLFDGFVLSRNSWPWCTALSEQIRVVEERFEIEKRAAAIHLQQIEKENLEKQQAITARAEQERVTYAAAQEKNRKDLSESQRDVLAAAKALVEQQEALGAKLVASQNEAIKLAQGLVDSERAFAVTLETKDRSLRTELAMTVESSMLREQQFGEQSLALRKLLNDEMAEIVRVRDAQLQSLQQDLASAVRISVQREKEFAAQLWSLQSQAEIEKAALIRLRDEHLSGLSAEYAARESALNETLRYRQDELTNAQRLFAVREQEITVQLLEIQKQGEAERVEHLHQTAGRERIQAEQLEKRQQETRLRTEEQERIFLSREDGLNSALSTHHKEIDQLKLQLEDLSSKLVESKSRGVQLEQEVGRFANRGESLATRLVNMEHTLSWRITRPFRQLRRLFSEDYLPAGMHLAANATGPHEAVSVSAKTTNYSFSGGQMASNGFIFFPSTQREYYLDYLLVFEDEAFVENVYRAVLGRAPDENGFAHYREKLREGESREFLLSVLRMSSEGMAFGTTIHGLDWKKIFRLGPKFVEKQRDANITNYYFRVPFKAIAVHEGTKFIDAAYAYLLLREPDENGKAIYFAMLRSGFRKSEIISAIMHSPECKTTGARVVGLNNHEFVARIERVPLIGAIASSLTFVFSIRENARKLRKLDSIGETDLTSEQSFSSFEQYVPPLLDQMSLLNANLNDLGTRIATTENSIRELLQVTEGFRAQLLAIDKQFSDSSLSAGEVERRVIAIELVLGAVGSIGTGMPTEERLSLLQKTLEQAIEVTNTLWPLLEPVQNLLHSVPLAERRNARLLAKIERRFCNADVRTE